MKILQNNTRTAEVLSGLNEKRLKSRTYNFVRGMKMAKEHYRSFPPLIKNARFLSMVSGYQKQLADQLTETTSLRGFKRVQLKQAKHYACESSAPVSTSAALALDVNAQQLLSIKIGWLWMGSPV